MRDTVREFISDKTLYEASEVLLEKLGVQYSPLVRGKSFNDCFQQNDFTFQYVEEVKKSIEEIWFVGYVNNTTFQNSAPSEENAKYFGLSIFACEIKQEAKFSRSSAVALTRAFNRISTRDVNDVFDMPVIVIIRQGAMLSLATCERSDRKDGNGEKVGKVTILRDMNCLQLHAGHRQILERIKENVRGCKSYEELHQKWFDSFNIKIISDKFFKDYKDAYEDIVEHITGKRMKKINSKWVEVDNENPCKKIMSEFSCFADPEKSVRDYVKNLMGRLVFIQFLQKKGWMGVPAGDSWDGGDPEFLQNLFHQSEHKEDFVDKVLEPLFNALNTRRENDLISSTEVSLGKQIKVPYLNGGLFDVSDADKLHFKIPSKFFWNSDERDAEEHPGILRLFANYNFTIDENAPDNVEVAVDPEMLSRIFENLLEDNKEKGAFYTPKEIVQYMCRESLIAYLQTDINDEQIKNTIRQFVTEYDASILSEGLKETLDQKLKEVKICDPAIGSGAFPMGMLHELYACRKAIEGIDDDTAVSVKTHIIQNNIYGVDIEKGAVDIARLRFWLALIVDEKTPHALPNMDFKIMQGNSLLEQYEGVNLSGMSLDEEKKRKAKKDQAWQATLAFDEKYALDNIQHAIKKYYLIDDYEAKISLRNIINENVRNYIINLKGCTPDVQRKVEQLPIPNDKFFLWHIYFKEVFDNGGFDIVIANPPYIDSESMINQGMGELRDILKKQHASLEGNWDMYMAFLEFSLSIAKTVVFITPDKWLSKPFGKKFRGTRMIERMSAITRAGSKVFENATVDAIITLFVNKSNKLSVNEFEQERSVVKITSKGVHSIKDLQDPFVIDYLFADNIDVIVKMDTQYGKIRDLAECEGACATSDAYKLQPYINDVQTPNYNEDYIVINTGTISKYYKRWGATPMTYLGKSYLCPTVKRTDFNTNFGSTYVRRASRPKLIFKGLNLLDVCLDKDAIVLPAKTTNVICSEDVDLLKFLCGLLNSKLVFYYIKLKYSSSSYCGGITFTKNMINYLPVNIHEDRSSIVEIVDKILLLKEIDPLNDTSDLEAKLDRQVYKLYELSNEEIAIVENALK